MKRDENDDPPSRDDVVTRMDVDSDVTLKGVRNRLLIFGPTIVVGLLGAWDGRIPPVLLWSIIGAWGPDRRRRCGRHGCRGIGAP